MIKKALRINIKISSGNFVIPVQVVNAFTANDLIISTVSSDTQLPITSNLIHDNDVILDKIIVDTTLSVNTVERATGAESAENFLENLTKAEQPVYDNVNDQIQPDGQDDILTGTIPSFSTSNCTLFAYLKSTDTSGVKSLLSIYQNSNADNAFQYGVEFGLVDGKATCWYGDGTDYQMIQESTASDHSLFEIWEFVNDGGTRRFLIDGVEIGNSTSNYTISVDRTQLGGRGSGNYTNFEIKTFFFYNENKSSGDRSTLRNHITTRF